MKHKKILILFLLVSFILLSGCQKVQESCSVTDYSAVKLVDVQKQPFAFVECPSMKISELEDPMHNELSAGAINAALDYIFERFQLSQFKYEFQNGTDKKEERSDDYGQILDSVTIASVVMDSEDNAMITALLYYSPGEHKMENVPTDVDPVFEFALDHNIVDANGSSERDKPNRCQKKEVVLYMSQSQDKYAVGDCEYKAS